MGYKSSIQFYIDVPLPYIRFSVYIKIQFCEYLVEPSLRITVIYTFWAILATTWNPKVPVFYCLMKKFNSQNFYKNFFVVIFNKSR